MTSVSATDLISLFIGIECISLTSYILAGMSRNREESVEGSLKYFFLGGLSSGLLIFGIILLYGTTGDTNMLSLREYLNYDNSYLIKISSFLICFSLIFKLGGAPFHV